MACPRAFKSSSLRRRLEVGRVACPRSFKSSSLRRRLEVRKGGLPPHFQVELIAKKIRGKEGWLAPALSQCVPSPCTPTSMTCEVIAEKGRGRVDGVLPETSCRPVPLGTVRVAFPHTALQPSFGADLRNRSISYSPLVSCHLVPFSLPLWVADVCPPAIDCCEGLHSVGITRLLRYSSPHP